MIVVDTNIIVHMTFATPYSPMVSSLHQKNSVWEAPSLWKSEFLKVLSLYHRKGIINYDESLNALDFAERLIGGREHRVLAKSIVDVVINSACSSYDCEFVVLAQKLGTRLITYDNNIIQEFPDVAVNPDVYLSQSE